MRSKVSWAAFLGSEIHMVRESRTEDKSLARKEGTNIQ